MKKIKYFIPSLVIMIFIFMFSQQTGNESSGMSSNVVHFLQNYFPFISNYDLLHTVIRKMAHMSEYALLTGSFLYAYSHYHLSSQKIYFYSLLSTFLYACSDEIHQLFITGRTGQLFDVCIDTCGGLILLLVIFLSKKHN